MLSKDYTFASERLSYRGINEDDTELIVAWRNDSDNARNFFSKPPTLESHRNWFKQYLNDSNRYDFMIIDSDGEPIGTINLTDITKDSCDIGYMIGERTARKKGYATEAVRAISKVAFDVFGVKQVRASIKPENIASEKVVAGGGFRKHKHVWVIDAPDSFFEQQ